MNGWTTLLAQLEAQLDREEQLAVAAGGDRWHAGDGGVYPADAARHPSPFAADPYGDDLGDRGRHIAEQDPAGTLRKVAAVREILGQYRRLRAGEDAVGQVLGISPLAHAVEAYERVLRVLLEAYAPRDPS